MASERAWFVRAGENNKYADEFSSQGFIAIGWKEIGPLTSDVQDDVLSSQVAKTYPSASSNARKTWANEIRQFLREMHSGDIAVTYDPNRRGYLIGTVTSDVEWVANELPRRRTVEWTNRAKRDALNSSSQSFLGRPLTMFQINSEVLADLEKSAVDLTEEDETSTPALPLLPGVFSSDDFDVLKRNAKSLPWGELPDSDRSAIKSLRHKLMKYAQYLKNTLEVKGVKLKPFASHPNPSGRNAGHYWACVYPEQVGNKSFALQLFVIVTADYLEYGFGLGSGTVETDNAERKQTLTREFDLRRKALREIRSDSVITNVGAMAASLGFRFRAKWVHSADDAPQYNNIDDWIEHATGSDGGGAAISKLLLRDEALALGEKLPNQILSELQPFAPIISQIYAKPTQRPETDITEGSSGPAINTPAITLDWLQKATLWEKSALEEILESLDSKTPQVVLAGPPGTSKTWVAEAIGRYITQGSPNAVDTVQFHPSYTYEEFVEGLRPVLDGGALQFAPADGIILRAVKGLTPDDPPRVLIIDEMNRANLPRVFGELLNLLEYRDKPINLQYSQNFSLPSSLRLIGTMNTADRNIRSIDIALRRRFDFFDCAPDKTILEKYFQDPSRSNEVTDLITGFVALNERLTKHLDRHHTVGHAFFMATPFTVRRLQRVWKYKLQPLLEEYFFDQPELLKEFDPKELWKAFGDAH